MPKKFKDALSSSDRDLEAVLAVQVEDSVVWAVDGHRLVVVQPAAVVERLAVVDPPVVDPAVAEDKAHATLEQRK